MAAITTIRLGDLSEGVAAAAAAAGVGASTWLRELARAELKRLATDVAVRAPATDLGAAAAPYRAWLEPDLTADLDALVERGRFRSRAAVIRALIKGVSMDGGAAEELRTVADRLGLSNHHLSYVRRDLEDIAAAVQTPTGRVSIPNLEKMQSEIAAHLELASKLVTDIRRTLLSKAEPE